MKIAETSRTLHEIICIHWNGADYRTHEKWIDIHKDDKGNLLDISIGGKEISAFELQILDFLKKEGKL